MAAAPPPPGGLVSGPSYRVRGLLLTEHRLVVPVDRAKSSASGDVHATLTLFAREASAADKPPTASTPWLVFLQGGPGFEAPRPAESGGWIKAASDRGFRILLLDQRGTGLSGRVSAASIAEHPGGAEAAAEYLSHFRAPDIVADCEALRAALGAPPWTVLGQSFGGFCSLSYLSLAPAGLACALITGGLAPLAGALPASGAEMASGPADAAYRALLPRWLAASARYYARFPGDAEVVRRVVLFLDAAPCGGVATPTGGWLTPSGLQLLGWGLGGAGGFEALHYLLETAFEEGAGQGGQPRLSLAFLRGWEASLPFDTNPLYALLHEACYADGGPATRWAAQRARDAAEAASAGGTGSLDAVALARAGRDVPFTGEAVFPWLFDGAVASLAPLAPVAAALAARTWGPLYDAAALAANSVPCAATAYYDDLYVDFDLAMQTAARTRGLRVWVTNEFLHSGVREDGPRVLGALLALARDEEPVR